MQSNSSHPVFPFNTDCPEIVYHAVLQGINDPFNIVDRDFRIVWANEPKARLFRKNQNDLIGKFCFDVFQRRQEVCPHCPVKEAFSSGKTCVMETHLTVASGSRHPCEIRAYPVHDRHGDILYGVTIGFDISARNRRVHGKPPEVHSDNSVSTLRAPFPPPSSPFWKEERIYVDLTSREIEVLSLVATGLTNNDIASSLSISPHTVKSHVIHIFNKLGVSDRTQAAVRGAYLGLI